IHGADRWWTKPNPITATNIPFVDGATAATAASARNAMWRALFIVTARVLEKERRHRRHDLVGRVDRARRELEMPLAPVEEPQQLVLRRAGAGTAFDLVYAALRDEQPRDVGVAHEDQHPGFALEFEQRQQRAERDVFEAAAEARVDDGL